MMDTDTNLLQHNLSGPEFPSQNLINSNLSPAMYGRIDNAQQPVLWTPQTLQDGALGNHNNSRDTISRASQDTVWNDMDNMPAAMELNSVHESRMFQTEQLHQPPRQQSDFQWPTVGTPEFLISEDTSWSHFIADLSAKSTNDPSLSNVMGILNMPGPQPTGYTAQQYGVIGGNAVHHNRQSEQPPGYSIVNYSNTYTNQITPEPVATTTPTPSIQQFSTQLSGQPSMQVFTRNPAPSVAPSAVDTAVPHSKQTPLQGPSQRTAISPEKAGRLTEQPQPVTLHSIDLPSILLSFPHMMSRPGGQYPPFVHSKLYRCEEGNILKPLAIAFVCVNALDSSFPSYKGFVYAALNAERDQLLKGFRLPKGRDSEIEVLSVVHALCVYQIITFFADRMRDTAASDTSDSAAGAVVWEGRADSTTTELGEEAKATRTAELQMPFFLKMSRKLISAYMPELCDAQAYAAVPRDGLASTASRRTQGSHHSEDLRPSPADLQQTWQKWIILETIRRTVFLIHILNVATLHTGKQNSFFFEDLDDALLRRVPLPTPERVWKAGTPTAWQVAWAEELERGWVPETVVGDEQSPAVDSGGADRAQANAQPSEGGGRNAGNEKETERSPEAVQPWRSSAQFTKLLKLCFDGSNS
jgi:hypothetical protein